MEKKMKIIVGCSAMVAIAAAMEFYVFYCLAVKLYFDSFGAHAPSHVYHFVFLPELLLKICAQQAAPRIFTMITF